MVNDVNKLKAAITNLENQAGKVKEFSGVLHAVNEARIEIDETKDVLKENANDTKQFLNDSRSSFDQLNICINSLEERLGKIEQNQIEARIEIDETKDVLKENAKDTKQFLNDSRSSFNQLNICVDYLEERLGKIEQNQIELRESINSLDIVSPEDLVKLKGEIGFVVTENMDGLKRHIEVITSQSKEKLSSRMTLIALISVGSIIGIGALI
jgi:chromosome segregation ATPase